MHYTTLRETFNTLLSIHSLKVIAFLKYQKRVITERVSFCIQNNGNNFENNLSFNYWDKTLSKIN